MLYVLDAPHYSPDDVININLRRIEGEVHLRVICIKVPFETMLLDYPAQRGSIHRKQLRPQHRSLWDAKMKSLQWRACIFDGDD